MTKIRLAYVCDFSSPHARGLIAHYAHAPQRFDVHVFSTVPAEPMEHVQLVSLVENNTMQKLKSGWKGALLYRLVQYVPRLYAWLRIHKDVQAVESLRPVLLSKAAGYSFDIIHGLRTLPEGMLAYHLAQATGTPLALSSWGQDFVVWARSHPKAKAMTRQVLAHLSLFFPDNQRDADIARREYNMPSSAICHVMPATGGLDTERLDCIRQDAEATKAAPLISNAGPILLSVRGYDNIYVKTSALIRALPAILKQYPNARLIIDGQENHPGKAPLVALAKKLSVDAHIAFVHVARPELFWLMEHSDLYLSATTSDGLPMSLVEAMYFGMTPVCYRLASLMPPITPDQSGFFFDQFTPHAIAQSVHQALATRQKNTTQHRGMLRTHFDRATHLAMMEAHYAALIR